MLKVRKIYLNILYGAVLFVLIALLAFSNVERGRRLSVLPEVEMNYAEGDPFISQEDVQSLIRESVPDLPNKPSSEVRIDMIEMMLERQIYVKDADVSMDLDGTLNVKVTPRRAICRIVDTSGYSCYMDESGFMIPWSPSYSPRKPVFMVKNLSEGNQILGKNFNSADINDSVLKIKPLFGIHRLASYLDSSEFWNAIVDQVILGENLEIIPRAGGHRVILGDFSDIEEKLNKLLIFYRDGLNKVGWNKYSVINLQYKGQVVASAVEGGLSSAKQTAKIAQHAEVGTPKLSADTTGELASTGLSTPEEVRKPDSRREDKLSESVKSGKSVKVELETNREEKKLGSSQGQNKTAKKRSLKKEAGKERKKKQKKTGKT